MGALMTYAFEWDPVKAADNRAKHGVNFEDAATVFRDPQALTVFDPDHSRSEDRWITMGRAASGRLLVVVHVVQEESNVDRTIRMVSARKANASETKAYEGA
jgi:uncharacterized DUF497 family protein